MVVKSKDEIEDLKAQWVADPCWDLATTEGFEAYKDELFEFSRMKEVKWKLEVYDRIHQRALELKCSFELAKHILGLEERIAHLEQRDIA